MRSGIRRPAALAGSLAWAAAVAGVLGLAATSCGSIQVLDGSDGGRGGSNAGTGGGPGSGSGGTTGGKGGMTGGMGGVTGGTGGRATGGTTGGTGGRATGGMTGGGVGGRGTGGAPPDASVDRPCLCSTIFSPVCGTDGRTYNNPCEAQCANVPVAHDGACVAACGTPSSRTCCGLDSDCGALEECAGPGCAAGGKPNGVCKPRPARASDGCWTNADCGSGGICSGASVCPCGSACILPDKMGTCSV